MVTDFEAELRHLLNCCSRENGSDTPDFVLARYLTACLEAFDTAVERREAWYGRMNAAPKTQEVQFGIPIDEDDELCTDPEEPGKKR